jgi:hypothetical protein
VLTAEWSYNIIENYLAVVCLALGQSHFLQISLNEVRPLDELELMAWTSIPLEDLDRIEKLWEKPLGNPSFALKPLEIHSHDLKRKSSIRHNNERHLSP